MSAGDNLTTETVNFEPQGGPPPLKPFESIFTIDDNFDPIKACSKLINREKECEKYIIQEQIAQGGMGAIFRVYNRDLKRHNVLKIMHAKIMENRQMFISFIDEARISAQLEHPNIIPVHDLGVLEDNKPYFSMKEIIGDGLDSILRRIKQGDPHTCEKYTLFPLLTIFRKVCDAMAFAHSRNIIHRDIKPENIMVGDFGEVLLVDWGLARCLDQEEVQGEAIEFDDIDPLADTISNRRRTRYGLIKGTPAFMAPEMAKGMADEIDKRSDIFLLGSTLYAIATLSAPFLGDDVIEIIENSELCRYENPQDRAPERELPIELCRIILKAMAPNPDHRYQTVVDIIEDIDDLMEGRTVSEQRNYQPGDLLMSEGEKGHEAFVIKSGQVMVFKTVQGKQVPLVTLKEGDSIGEMAMISDAPRSASVQALTKTNVVVITEDLIKRGLDKLSPWMGNIVQALVHRLRTTNANVHPLLNTDCSYHVLNQLLLIYLCWGRPQRDEFNNCLRVTLNIEKTIIEIAANLCLTRDRVSHVIAVLVEWSLLYVYENDDTQFYLPNLGLVGQFLKFLKHQYQILNAYDHDLYISILANKQEIVFRRNLGGEFDQNEELEMVPGVDTTELTGCATSDELLNRFIGIQEALLQRPLKSAMPTSTATIPVAPGQNPR